MTDIQQMVTDAFNAGFELGRQSVTKPETTEPKRQHGSRVVIDGIYAEAASLPNARLRVAYVINSQGPCRAADIVEAGVIKSYGQAAATLKAAEIEGLIRNIEPGLYGPLDETEDQE